MSQSFLLIFFTLVAFSGESFAAKNDFKLQGRIGLGLQSSRNEEDQRPFEMRLGVTSKRRQRIRANIELRADDGSRDIRINDAFLDYKNTEKTVRVRAGRGKKILGWEYQYPTSARLTIDRTAGYGFLEERGIVGRDFFIEYLRIGAVAEPAGESGDFGRETGNDDEDLTVTQTRQDAMDSGWSSPWAMIPTDECWRLGGSIHWDETGNASVIAQGLKTLSEHTRLGSWVYARRSITGGAPLWTYGGMVSLLYADDRQRAAFEWYAGYDPYRTLLERDLRTYRMVGMSFVRAEYSRLWGSWAPYVAASYLVTDLDNWGNRVVDPILGLRYFVQSGLDLALEGRYTNQRVADDPGAVPYASSSVALMGRYYF